jgi:hypothetical protein
LRSIEDTISILASRLVRNVLRMTHDRFGVKQQVRSQFLTDIGDTQSNRPNARYYICDFESQQSNATRSHSIDSPLDSLDSLEVAKAYNC